MAALVSAEPRAPPAAIGAVGRFVVQPPHIDRQALHEEHRPPADCAAALLLEPFQEFLVAKKRVGRLRGFERLHQAHLSHNGAGLIPSHAASLEIDSYHTWSPTRYSFGPPPSQGGLPS